MMTIKRLHRPIPRGFTLMELLVVIGIIAILMALTVVAVAGMARDAKLSTGKNRVMSALGIARALAVQSGKPAGVVCMVQWDRDHPDVRQKTILRVVEWSGRTRVDRQFLINQFDVATGIEPLQLPEGIKVAGPWYNRADLDDVWISQPQFPQADLPSGGTEAAGRVVGVLFGPSGEVITAVPESDSNFRFVDLDNDHEQTLGVDGSFWFYNEQEDEPNIEWVPFIAVYDDDEAREFAPGGTGDWNNSNTRDAELRLYINGNADRIHFNRYTGVAMK